MELQPHLFKLQALYASMINGGKLITPSLVLDRKNSRTDKIISKETSIN